MKSLLLGMKCFLKDLIFANVWCQIKQIMYNFHPLEVVSRDSETQLQVAEKINKITSRING